MPPVRRRGPYKRYLHDLAVPVPRQTAWERLRAARQDNAEEHQDEDVRPARESSPSSPSEDDGSSSSDSDSDHGGGMNMAASSSDSSESDSDRSSSDDDADGGNANQGMDEEVDMDREPANPQENDDHVQQGDGGGDEEEGGEPEVVQYADGLEQNDEVRRGPPLYQGCPLSVMESDILIMSFVVRWGLEDKSIEELLQLIDCHLPCSAMKSQYKFLDRFPVPDLTKIWLTCSKCFRILPMDFERGECENCQELLVRSKLKDDGNFFIELSLREQLKSIVENESTYRLLRRQCEENDVISGRFYRALKDSGVCDDDDLTLQWNTDGVSPFNSSGCQAWPIQACVNELPFHARRENMILCGLYFGKDKPHFNSFLKPFVDELESLHTTGFQCMLPGQRAETTIKVHTILASVDSIARAPLQGIKQFNGSYGCSFCLHRGMRIDRGNGSTRVYAGDLGAPRTMAQHMNALEELAEYNRVHRKQKEHVEGVKYASRLLLLSVFCVTSSFVPDYMHSVLEGVVKVFFKHWTDGTYREKEWYLNKQKRKLISEKLLAVKPPVEITRAPRGLGDFKLMKASELRNFLLYYSLPCMHGILPGRYLQHWFLLVFGINVFLREKFSQEEATQAKHALRKFYAEIRTVYPDCIHLYTFNVHLLLHLPRAVENFGGLWASSTFPYEHFNGVLSRLITGTRHVPEHICSSYIRLRQISHLGPRVFSDPQCSIKGKNLFNSLTSKYRSSKFSRQSGQNLRLFGSGDIHELSLVERVSAQELLGNNFEMLSHSHSFRRMIFQGTVYHAGSYEALRVRNNSVVKLNCGRIMYIKYIVLVIRRNIVEQTCVLIGEELDVLDETLCSDRDLRADSRHLIHVCRSTDRIVCALPKDISRKCILIPFGNAKCVLPLVNMLERD